MSRMEYSLIVRLSLQTWQFARLRELQGRFIDACNFICPTVREARCWNRVALHHLVYKDLRAKFPDLGSQMACNVIYSVCRAARSVYQDPASPWSVGPADSIALPLIRFGKGAPVYFDRHTLSLRGGVLSLFTLDGRMKVRIGIGPRDEELLRASRLREIALVSGASGYELLFTFLERKENGPSFTNADFDFADHIIVDAPNVELLDFPASMQASKPMRRGGAL